MENIETINIGAIKTWNIEAMTWENVTYTEKDAKRIAMDYEATLYRYKYIDGEVKESKMLYDPWQIFG